MKIVFISYFTFMRSLRVYYWNLSYTNDNKLQKKYESFQRVCETEVGGLVA